MNIFRSKGFDTIIAKGVVVEGSLTINGTVQIDGEVRGEKILSATANSPKTNDVLLVNGVVATANLSVNNLTVTGSVTATTITVEGTLAVQAGAVVKADVIYYRTLAAEPGAVIMGSMKHLDYVSEGEQV